VPEGVDDLQVRQGLLNEYGIEIGAGLGPFKGKAWRIGLMGHSSTKRNVMLVLAGLAALLSEQGFAVGDPIGAAAGVFRGH
jgi:alanine-glyoxylate transaminase/serine-glyoxylate transaminase/serine-pyruvate transaminase